MYKKIKAIREEVKRVIVQHQSAPKKPANLSKVNTPSFDKRDSKNTVTSVAGKVREPDRGPERSPSVPKAHTTKPTNEKAEVTRYNPTHKIISLSGQKGEIKMGASVQSRTGESHVIDRIEPSRFGGAADRVITHSTVNPAMTGSFHPKDVGVKFVRRIKEGRDSEFNANKSLVQKGSKDKMKGTDAYHSWAATKNDKKKLKESVDHSSNPYHDILTQHGFQHHATHNKNSLGGGTYIEHYYTHPAHGKTHVLISNFGKGKESFVHRHEQSNGIMAPSHGDNKNQLHRSLSREYGVPKGMEEPKLTAWEKRAPHPTVYKMNEDIGMAAGAPGDPGAVRDPNANYAAQKARSKTRLQKLVRRNPKALK